MRALILLAVVLSTCLAAASADEVLHWQAREGDRMTNGGFEEAGAPGEIAAGWIAYAERKEPGRAALVETAPAARTGKTCIRLKAEGENLVGLNRAFVAGKDAGAMIPLASGWAEFWYQAPSSETGENLRVYIIAVPDNLLPESGRATYQVPREHIGDGQWHRGVLYFDFSAVDRVKYVLFAPRINEGGAPGSGELLVDDVAVYPRGPDLLLNPGGFSAPLARDGGRVKLRGRVRNLGSAPATKASATVVLQGPAQLEGAATIPVPPVAPGKEGGFEWEVRLTGTGPVTARVRVGGGSYGEASWPAAMVAIREETPGKVVCATETARVRYVPQGDWGFFRVDARPTGTGDWRAAGALPFLGWGVVGEERDILVFPARAASGSGPWTSTVKDAHGRTWAMETRLAPARGGAIRFESRMAAGRGTAKETPIHTLFAPWLLLGESTAKQEACFPGLEYLAPEEPSSSDLDGHYPHDIRWAPHPNKVTIPFLSVSFRWGTAAMVWDPLQKWDGAQDRPQPLFAVPNRFGGQENHLLALALPGGIEGRGENRVEAEKPATASVPLRVSADLFFAPGENTDAAVAWYLRNRGLPPDPQLPRSFEEGLRLCVDSTEARWSEEQKGWYGTSWFHRGAPPSADVARHLWLDAYRTGDARKRELWRSRARTAAEALGGQVGLSLGLHVGDALSAVEADTTRTQALLQGQKPEGGWAFGGNPHWDLGEGGKAVSGTSAANALVLLKHAAATGDEAALEAGLRALDFCNTHDTIPRGGQTWEVPLHTPDLIVAGYLLQAHIVAYEVTGDREWLRKARHWAYTGVPFIYLWKAPERPIMPYATLPVIGTSGWTNPWYGRPVQWCGIVYISPLQRFAEYDKSEDWSALSRGLLIASMQQQVDLDHRVYPDTAKTPPDQLYWYYPKEGLDRLVGMYPDNYRLFTDRNFCWDYLISPNSHAPLADPLLHHLGIQPEARSHVLRTPAGRVHVTAPVPIIEASLAAEGLTLSLENPKGWPVRVLAACVSQPRAVEVDGKEVPRGDLDGDGTPAWAYHGTRALCVVQTTGRRVVVRGVSRQAPKQVDLSKTTAWEFGEPGDPGGFAPEHDISAFSVRDGRLRVRVSGEDPWFTARGLRLDASRYRTARVRLRVRLPGGPAESSLEAFFCRQGEGIDAARSAGARLPCDGEMHEVAIPLGANPAWQGTITTFRLDPTHGRPAAEVEIDWIRFE